MHRPSPRRRSSLFMMAGVVAVAARAPSAEAQTNAAGLRQMAAVQSLHAARDRDEAWDAARRFGWTIRRDLGPTSIELRRVRDGQPQYVTTLNRFAAETVGANYLWGGVATGHELSGAGVTLAIWDAGHVYRGHREHDGRVFYGEAIGPVHAHATHVAGTMIGRGLNPLARGMSSSAELRSFDWFNDVSEMADLAADGLLLSNHSYGQLAGWYSGNLGAGNGWYWLGDTRLSETEDFKFGRYDEEARLWDGIAQAAPYYLICAAAGNWRFGGPPPNTPHFVLDFNNWVRSTVSRPRNADDGFDCINAFQLAKNILTVGAVHDVRGGYNVSNEVVLASFSSTGPVDDGRIKPDLCGNGIDLLSSDTTGADRYRLSSGTSMACPNVSGALGLLVEHQRRTHDGADMRAATLKALVLHTADEAGDHPGPDYTFGWGLLNTRTAARVISDDVTKPDTILEAALQNGGVIERTFPVDDAAVPVRATIVWTDPPGRVALWQLDPRDPSLVNDLDLRVFGPDGQTHLPWRLDPANPAAAAVRGDNLVDNVEHVLIDAPTPGMYRVQVSHKGTLSGGSQAFSMIVTAGCNAPAFTSEPADVAVCIGQSAVFEARPQANAELEWQIDGTPQGTGSTLRLDNVSKAFDGAVVQCVARNGCGEALSRQASLRVLEPPALAGRLGDHLVCEGFSVRLRSGATGDGLTYQWFKNDAPIAGATQPELAIERFGVAYAGRYAVRVANIACGSVMTGELRLDDCDHDGICDHCELEAGARDCNVNAILDSCEPLLSVAPVPERVLCLADGPFSLSVAEWVRGGRPPVTYEWRLMAAPTAASLSPADSAEPLFSPAIPGDYEIEATLRDASPAACAVTVHLRLRVTAPITMQSPEAPLVACVGREPVDLARHVIVSGGTDPLAFEWTVDSGPDLAGLSDPRSPTPAFAPSRPGQYVLRATAVGANGSGCAAEAVLHVDARPAARWLAPARPVASCVDRLPLRLTAPAATADGPALSYAWRVVSGPAGAELANAQHPSPSFSTTTPGEYVVEVAADVADEAGCEPAREQFTVAVRPPVRIASSTDHRVHCLGADGLELSEVASADGDSGNLEYRWAIVAGPSFAGLTDTFSRHARFLPDTAGLYRLRLTLTDQVVGGCQSQAELAVEAVPATSIEVVDSLRLTTDQLPVHLDSVVRKPGGAAGGRTWRIVEGPQAEGLSSPAGPDSVFAPSAVGRYVLEVETAGESGACASRDRMSVELADPLEIDPGGDVTVCSGVLSNPLGGAPLIRGGHPPYSVAWTTKAGDEALRFTQHDAQNPRVTAPDPRDYMVRVVVTDSSTTPRRRQAEARVHVMASPPATEVVMAVPVGVARRLGDEPGDFVGVEPYDFTWRFEDNPAGAATLDDPHSPQPSFMAAEAGRYRLTLERRDAGNCRVARSYVITAEASGSPPPLAGPGCGVGAVPLLALFGVCALRRRS